MILNLNGHEHPTTQTPGQHDFTGCLRLVDISSDKSKNYRRHETGNSRFRATLFSLDHPAPEQIGVQSVGQCNARDRHARLPTGADHPALELIAVSAPPPTGQRRRNRSSSHVSTKKFRGHETPTPSPIDHDAITGRLPIDI